MADKTSADSPNKAVVYATPHATARVKKAASMGQLNMNDSSSDDDAGVSLLRNSKKYASTSNLHENIAGKSGDIAPTVDSPQPDNGDDEGTHRSASSVEDTQAHGNRQLVPADEPLPFIDAQGIWPSTACVFVANLNQQIEDSILEAEVTKTFSVYGTVFVKIRRDNAKKIPFAFCQFTNDESALNAIGRGRGTWICGRPCRTERAKANSIFIVWIKRTTSVITPEQAFHIMGRFGAVAKVEPLDPSIQAEKGIPHAMVVTYQMYDAGRDMASLLRRDSAGKKYQAMAFYPDKDAPLPAHRRWQNSQAQYSQYDIDRRSVYMGNLPHDVDEDELAELASYFGRILSIRLHRKPHTTFAFIEFLRPDVVEDLCSVWDDRELRGHVVRAARKEPRAFGRGQSQPNMSGHAARGGAHGSLGRGSAPGFNTPVHPHGHPHAIGYPGGAAMTPHSGSPPFYSGSPAIPPRHSSRGRGGGRGRGGRGGISHAHGGQAA